MLFGLDCCLVFVALLLVVIGDVFSKALGGGNKSNRASGGWSDDE